MAFFDKSLNAVIAAKNKATEALGEDNIEKLKKSGKDVLDVGTDVLNRTSAKLQREKSNSDNARRRTPNGIRSERANYVVGTCPHCGASLEAENGIDSFYCQYCGTKLILLNQHDEAVKAKAAKQRQEHQEKMVDKVSRHLNERAARKAAERERQRKQSSIQAVVALVVLLCLMVGLMAKLHFDTKAMEKKSIAEEANLQLVVNQIEEDIKNGDYDSALIKVNGLYYTTDYSSEIKKKWDNIRTTLIVQIEDAKKAADIDKEKEAAPSEDLISPVEHEEVASNYYAHSVAESSSVDSDKAFVETEDEELAETDNSKLSSNAQDSIAMIIVNKNAEDYHLGDTVLMGKYAQGHAGGGPIQWLVIDIDKTNNSLLLMSKYILDAQPFNTEGGPASWENCSLRTWLNNTFYLHAFTEEERGHIIDHTIKYGEMTVPDKVSIPYYDYSAGALHPDVQKMERAQETAYAYSKGLPAYKRARIHNPVRTQFNFYEKGSKHDKYAPPDTYSLYWAITNNNTGSEDSVEYIDGWGSDNIESSIMFNVELGVRPEIRVSLD